MNNEEMTGLKQAVSNFKNTIDSLNTIKNICEKTEETEKKLENNNAEIKKTAEAIIGSAEKLNNLAESILEKDEDGRKELRKELSALSEQVNDYTARVQRFSDEIRMQNADYSKEIRNKIDLEQTILTGKEDAILTAIDELKKKVDESKGLYKFGSICSIISALGVVTLLVLNFLF